MVDDEKSHKALKKENALLKRKLQQTEQSLQLLESSAENTERVYHATLKTLIAQKEELNKKNVLLESVENELRRKNQELELSATTDALTGAYNRRKITHILTQELERYRRYQQKLSVILMDLDHFKNVNDIHGHHVGDDVLKQVALIASSSLRDVDFFGRWGGEEFIILCPSSDVFQAQVIAERLRQLIEIDSLMSVLRVTSSFGVAAYTEELDGQELIHCADIALYDAKKNRNAVCVYSEPIYFKL